MKEKLDFILNPEAVKDSSVSIFDIIERPEKPIEHFSAKELGKDGERVATLYLMRKGFEVVDLNWECKLGEIDIVVKDPEHPRSAILVEVKTRLSLKRTDPVIPELNVTVEKQEKYRELALLYLAFHKEYDSVRFDVIAISEVSQKKASLRHLINAFCIDGE